GVTMRPTLSDLRHLAEAVQACRQLLDLDADAAAVADVLGADRVLAPLVAAAPGLRVPGHVDGFELAVRAILGQQVSVAGARTTAAKFAERFGDPVDPDASAVPALTHAFPRPAADAAPYSPHPRGAPPRGRPPLRLAGPVGVGAPPPRPRCSPGPAPAAV